MYQLWWTRFSAVFLARTQIHVDEQELNYLMEAFYIPVSMSLFQYKLILHSFHTHIVTQPSEQVNYTVLSYLNN